MRPSDLMQVLHQLPKVEDKNLLVGFNTADDAGVYKLTPDIALIQTVDFFTPVVDDPYVFGQISAANALSDVYAMGGTPLLAMNIVGFPIKKLPVSILLEILRGGMDKAKSADVLIVGGHSIDDEELKYGLSITGTVHPNKVVTNSNAKPGDKLILTKPLGIGIITTAIKNNVAGNYDIEKVIKVMSELNKNASLSMQEVGVNACTDITGFGFLGHLYEMLSASGVSAKIFTNKVPYIESAIEYAEAGYIPGGTKANKNYISPNIKLETSISNELEMILYDAQTSGGLLISVEANKVDELVSSLKRREVETIAIVGEIIDTNIEDEKGKIYLV